MHMISKSSPSARDFCMLQGTIRSPAAVSQSILLWTHRPGEKADFPRTATKDHERIRENRGVEASSCENNVSWCLLIMFLPNSRVVLARMFGDWDFNDTSTRGTLLRLGSWLCCSSTWTVWPSKEITPDNSPTMIIPVTSVTSREVVIKGIQI